MQELGVAQEQAQSLQALLSVCWQVLWQEGELLQGLTEVARSGSGFGRAQRRAQSELSQESGGRCACVAVPWRRFGVLGGRVVVAASAVWARVCSF